MPFEIVRNDIAEMRVDAIVNTVDVQPGIGSGTDAGIHRKAGPKLLDSRKRIGAIRVGDAAVTRGYDLPARYVIHTVGPVWQGGTCREEQLLRSCYETSLKLARRHGCRSVAFPLLCAGNCGFPKSLALQIAVSTISGFLMKHEMQVYLVVFSRDAYQLSEQLFRRISSFIDERLVEEVSRQEYGGPDTQNQRRELLSRSKMPPGEPSEAMAGLLREEPPAPCAMAAPDRDAGSECRSMPMERSAAAASRRPIARIAPSKASLEQMLREADAGFSETLLKLIDKTGKKDAEIYKKANVDRKLFSKIRNHPDYRPSKATAVAFAIALELDLLEARDLIGRAGYALTHSSKFDIIVEYFIRERNYDVFELNEVLFEFDQPLIGA